MVFDRCLVFGCLAPFGVLASSTESCVPSVPKKQGPRRTRKLDEDPASGTREILGNPRFPLKGSLKGDIDIAIDIDVDIDIDLNDRET